MTGRLKSRPRGRAGKPIVMVVLLILLLLALGHLLWRNAERRRFMAAVHRLQQAGEPVLLDDFNHPPTNDPNNPVPKWRAAARALGSVTIDTPLSRLQMTDLDLPLTDREVALLRDVVNSNRTSLTDAAAAAGKPGWPDWDIHFKEPIMLLPLPDLNPQRNVATLLRGAAMDAHQRGNDAEAVGRLRQLLALERAMYRYPSIVGHLVGVGIGATASDTLGKIAPDLRIGSSPDSGQPASVEQINRLMADLLDETAQREGQRYAFQYERMTLIDMTMQFAHGKFDFAGSGGSTPSARPVGGYLMSPTIYADGQTILNIVATVANAAQSSNWPSARAKLKLAPDPDRLAGARHFLLMSFAILRPAWDRTLQHEFKGLTDRRLTAMAVAFRWYATEHSGRLPDRLDDLVPKYLSAIPSDPMTADSPMKYRPGENPVVYSVGEDGVDDGGSEQPLDSRRPDFRWNQKDVVIRLTRQARKPKTDDADEQEASEGPASSAH